MRGSKAKEAVESRTTPGHKQATSYHCMEVKGQVDHWGGGRHTASDRSTDGVQYSWHAVPSSCLAGRAPDPPVAS